MMLGTELKLIVVERVFAPWNSTAGASNGHTISDDDLSMVQYTIW
jgi:hypothetical protein